MLLNQAVHTIDLLLWLLGDVDRVEARMTTKLHAIEAEDTAVTILEFANGALGILQVTIAAHPGYPRRLEIAAQKVRNSGARSHDCGQPVQSARGLSQAIEQDGTPLCDGREARRSLALIEAIYRASRNSTTAADA